MSADFAPRRTRTSLIAEAIAALAASEPPWRRALLSDLAPRPHDVVLVIGAGDGQIPLSCAATGATALVLDPDPAALGRARQKAADAGVRIEAIHAAPEDVASYVNELAPTRIVFLAEPDADFSDRIWRRRLAACRDALRARGVLHLVSRASSARALGETMMRLRPTGPIGGPAALMRDSGFTGVHQSGLYPDALGIVRLYRGGV